jgi:lipopolysaccharide transport system ATP-binding protein
MSPVIRVEGLSKRYTIGARKEGAAQYDTFREALIRKLKSPFRGLSLSGPQPSTPDPQRISTDFWALKDVSFEIQQGEVVGIIGRNGAGKSTLLKILSRITEPTSGRIGIRGRLASLLEVGTGFHPELTGRENIFLNGVILGMTRLEVKKRFDEIVAFAEVEQFLDTPVKRYSSGMYVRLAFAVAAHLDPEILVVDEVLAVGDAQFQKKCLGKLDSISRASGRTVLLVSHNMSTVSALCPRAILLKSGQLEATGDSASVINTYMASGPQSPGELVCDAAALWAIGTHVRLVAARTVQQGRPAANVMIDSALTVELDFEVLAATSRINAHLQLLDGKGVCVCVLCSPSKEFARGVHRQSVEFPSNFFNDGVYRFNILLLRNEIETEVTVNDALVVNAQETAARDTSWSGTYWGCIRPKLDWQITENLPVSQG